MSDVCEMDDSQKCNWDAPGVDILLSYCGQWADLLPPAVCWLLVLSQELLDGHQAGVFSFLLYL